LLPISPWLLSPVQRIDWSLYMTHVCHPPVEIDTGVIAPLAVSASVWPTTTEGLEGPMVTAFPRTPSV
jgi:hypothetical protein